jgi:hypothetical protein
MVPVGCALAIVTQRDWSSLIDTLGTVGCVPAWGIPQRESCGPRALFVVAANP